MMARGRNGAIVSERQLRGCKTHRDGSDGRDIRRFLKSEIKFEKRHELFLEENLSKAEI